MKRTNLLLLAAALVSGSVNVSCADQQAQAHAEGLRLVMLGAESLCDENKDNLGHEDFELPREAASVVIRVSNSEHETVERVEAASIRSGRVMLTSIPPGDYTVDVAMCDSADQAQWVGTSPGVTVTANTKTFPSVLLSPVGFGACTNLVDGLEGAGFVSSATDATGAYLIGGVQTFQSGASGGEGTASTQIRRFSALDGTVRKIGDLDEPRFGAWAEMKGDSIRIFGGAKTLSVSVTNPLTAGEAPSCAVVDFDTKTGTQTCLDSSVTMPAWPSVAKTDTRLVAVGGVEPDGRRSDQIFFLAGDVITSNTLPSRRYGATVVGIGSGTTFIYGGNADDLSNAALLVLENDGVSQLAYGDADEDGELEPAPTAIPFLASGHYLGTVGGREVVVVIGGHEYSPSSNVSSVLASKRVSLVFIDGAAGLWEQKTLDTGTKELLFERSAAQLVALTGGDLVLMGGFTSLNTHPNGADKCEGQTDQCFRTSTVRFRINSSTETLDIVDDSLPLVVGPFGARATVLSDGAMLVTSGMEDLFTPQIPERSELLRFSSDLDDLCVQ